MRKDSADQIKAQYQADHDYEEVIALLGEEEVEERLGLLDALEDLLSEEIASFALDLTQDLIDEEEPKSPKDLDAEVLTEEVEI